MATNFPTSLDTFTNPTGSDKLGDSVGGRAHSAMHADVNDAVRALQAKVGADGSAVSTSFDYNAGAVPFGPRDYGFLAWSLPHEACDSALTSLTSSNLMWVVRIRLHRPVTVTNIHTIIQTAGVGVSRSLVALYNVSQNLIAQSADAGAAFGSTGYKTVALTSPQAVTAGDYYIGFWETYSSSPGRPMAFAPSSSLAYALPQANSFPRFAVTTSSGLAATAPASFTVDAISGFIPWFAVS